MSALEEEIAAYLAECGVVDDSRAIVRPYARTGGRTRAVADLAIEALLISSDEAPTTGEHQQIADICWQPTSVAEIAAYTRLPIGAARVIISDMLMLGVLRSCSVEASPNGPTLDLMTRVIVGLRRI
jgi:uncharacterized protein DUF742